MQWAVCIKSTRSEAFRSSAMSCPTCTTTTPRSRATRRPSGCSARTRRVPSQLRRSSIFFCNFALFVGFHEWVEKMNPYWCFSPSTMDFVKNLKFSIHWFLHYLLLAIIANWICDFLICRFVLMHLPGMKVKVLSIQSFLTLEDNKNMLNIS